MTTNTPTAGGGDVTSWEISPSLPNGLSFGSTNGSIWGTPTVLQTTDKLYRFGLITVEVLIPPKSISPLTIF